MFWKKNILSQFAFFFKEKKMARKNSKNLKIHKKKSCLQYERVLTIFLLSYFEHRQIWLNILIDGHLITKLQKKSIGFM
jgi:hypothetical protein